MSLYKSLSIGLLCAISSSVMAASYQGKLEVLVEDYFKQKESKTVYQLHQGDTAYRLDLSGLAKKQKLSTGDTILIEGKEISTLNSSQKTIKVDALKKTKSLNEKDNKNSHAYAFDTRKIVTFIVDFNDKKASSSITKSNIDSILYTSPRSMINNYQRNSFGQVNFIRDTNNDGTGDIYSVVLNYDVGDSCDYHLWAGDALNAAIEMGIDLSLYQHKMFVVPQNVNCRWGGVGTVGCYSTVCNTWVRAYAPSQTYSQLVYIHELGHNLGMRHSATDPNNDGVIDVEYGDGACIMGVGEYNSLKELNAPHRDLQGYFNAFPNKIQQVTKSGIFTLSPLEQGVTAPNLLTLKIKKSATEFYYLSYRKNIGPFGPGTDSYQNKISLHKTIAGSDLTYFIKTLVPGEKFSDKSAGIYIDISSSGGDTAKVGIQLIPGFPR